MTKKGPYKNGGPEVAILKFNWILRSAQDDTAQHFGCLSVFTSRGRGRSWNAQRCGPCRRPEQSQRNGWTSQHSDR